MVQKIFWLPGETSATLGPNLRALLKLYSESVASSSPSGWAASRALAGLVGVCAQFLCGRDALDGCNKRKDALVSFALGCLRGE